MSTRTLTLRIDPKLLHDLQRISEAEHKTVSDFVREALEKTILVEQYRLLRKKILPFAEAQGLITEEEVMKTLTRKR